MDEFEEEIEMFDIESEGITIKNNGSGSDLLNKAENEDENEGKIKPIDKSTVHRICSGQVIVSLSTAIKELLENSIDANATVIDIRLIDSGSKSIEVTDNGSGVEECNFEGLALKHHTSKISEFDDLKSIGTFGFRGEALSSLCALANLTVITRSRKSSHAFKIEYDSFGRIKSKIRCAREPGTTVILKNIFYSLPVRHKEFLKNLKREFNKMVNIIYGYCLIVKGVSISSTNQLPSGNISKVISITGLNSIKERIISVFGTKQFSSLVEINSVEVDYISEETLLEYGLLKSNFKFNIYSFEGFISTPNSGRNSADRQYFFMNSRPCDSSKISRIINEVYRMYSRNQTPFVCLNIMTDQINLDVNVTPDKRSIFLQNEKHLFVLLKASLQATLLAAASIVGSESNSQVTSQEIILPFSQQLNIPICDENESQVYSDSISQAISSQKSEENFSQENSMLSQYSQSGFSPQLSTSNNNNNKKMLFGGSSSRFSKGSTTSTTNNKGSILDRFSFKPKNLGKEAQNNTAGPSSFKKAKKCDGNIKNYFKQFAVSSLKNDSQKNGLSLQDDNNSPNKTDISEYSQDFEVENEIGISQTYLFNNSLNSDDLSIMDYDDSPEKIELTESHTYPNPCNYEFEEDDDCDEIKIIYDDEIEEEKSREYYKKKITIDFNLEKIKRKLLVINSKNNAKKITATKFFAKLNPKDNKDAEQELRKQLSKEMFSKMRILGQFNLGFIIANNENDLFIIDQHASDEKYNYEDLVKNTIFQTQKLIHPIDLELTTVSANVLIENLDVFQKNGFDFEIDQENKVKMTKIPYSKSCEFGKSDVEELIFLLEDAPEKTFCRPSKVRDMFAMRACRKSVMIGTGLNSLKMRNIVNNMGRMDQPWNCPHGRPTIRHIFDLSFLPDNEKPQFNHYR